jgi:hypothetical protein
VSSPIDQQNRPGQPPQTAAPAGEPTVSIACVGCRRLVPVGAPCPHCGARTGTPTSSPITPVGDTIDPVSDPISDPESPSSEPASEPVDATIVLPPVPERTAELDLSALAPPPHLRPPAAARPASGRSDTSRRRALAVLAGAAALVVVGGAAVAGLRSGTGDDASGRASASTATSDVTTVDAADIRARASSTQQPDSGVTYGAANTLDGRPETAWNSDGKGAGATLTYTFATPVDLRSLTVLNGYQKVLRGSSGAKVDLYPLNQRARAVTVVTDAGRATWTLRDDRAPQTFTHDFGRTSTVTLEVTAVYPSQKYRDLAISDVSFAAAS